MTIVDGRHAYLLLEECAEGGGVGEVEQVGDFLYALVGAGDEIDGFLRDSLEHELLHGAARYRLHELREVLWRETQAVGVEAYAALVHIVLVNELHELHVGLQFTVRLVAAVAREFAEDAAHAVGEREQQQLAFVGGKHVLAAFVYGEQFGILRQLVLVTRMHHPARAWIDILHKLHADHRAAKDVAYGVGAIEDNDNGAVVALSCNGEAHAVGEEERLVLVHNVFRTFACERKAARTAHYNANIRHAEIVAQCLGERPYNTTRATDVLVVRHLLLQNIYVYVFAAVRHWF